MGIFAYQASSAERMMRGTISADSPLQAREQLRSQGLRVRDLKEVQSSGATKSWNGLSWRRRPEAEVTGLVQELSTLLGAGIPLLEALDAVTMQFGRRFASTLMVVRQQVAAGASLADAFRQQPRVFDELCVAMVDVGQRTGMLDEVLAQLAKFRRRSEQLKGRLLTALIYPIIVLCAGMAVMVFLSTFVVPKLLETLIEAGRPLPLATRIVKGFSDLLLNDGWMVALGAIAIVAVVMWALQKPRIQMRWHALQLRLPLVGRVIRLQAIVRMAVMLATLTRSGMEFEQALRLTARATRNLKLRAALENGQEAIAAGRDIAPALAATGAFPTSVIRIMEVGQATGRLDEMLERLASDYDVQVQTATQRLIAVFEPAMILLLAGLIGFIVLAIILPYLEAGNVL
jgi:type II secretory pathway component PulF